MSGFFSGGVFAAVMAMLNLPTGAQAVGYKLDGVGTVKRAMSDKAQEFPTLADFGDVGKGGDDTAAIQRAINHGGYISVKAGTYKHGTLDFKGKSVIFVGDGEDRTIFQANAAGTMFDVKETGDRVKLPLIFAFMTLEGADTATAGIETRYRHKTVFQNVTIQNINGDCLNEVDGWNNLRENMTLSDSVNGVVLQGANNNVQFNGMSVSGHTQYQAKILDGGTVAGGSVSVAFNNCDFEYAPGYGVYVKTRGVVRFNDCYIGEEIAGTVFDMGGGMVVMTGGFAYFGKNPASYLGYLTGGKLYFKNVNITGGANATIANMFVGGGGRAHIEDSPAYVTATGVQVMNGDTLDYGRHYETYAPKFGRLYTDQTQNGTHVKVSTDNEITLTCQTVSGTANMGIRATLTGGFTRNKPGNLIVVYKSTKPLKVRLAGGAFGVAPVLNIGTLPATGGNVKTAVLFDWMYDASAVTIIEVVMEGAAVADVMTVSELMLADYKYGKSDTQALFYNLGKA